MEDPFARLIEVTRRLARSAEPADAERMRSESAALQAELQERMQAAATATDETGLVQATVRYDGTVDAVHISPHAIRDLANEELGAACLGAVLAARAAAVSQVGEWLQPGAATEPDRGPSGRSAARESHGWEG